MTQLSEEKLETVAGGRDEIRNMNISLQLPTIDSDDIKVTVYVDGVLNTALCNKYDSCVKVINLNISGNRGQKRVDIKINDLSYKTYIVDFDKRSYSEI